MADFIKSLLGGLKPSTAPSPAGDDADFADFAGAPDPTPASTTPMITQPLSAQPTAPILGSGVAYTKWYRVWERTSPRDFYQEAFILPFVIILVALHAWGRRKNRRIAREWISAHAPALEKEFALVGFSGRKGTTPTKPEDLLKEKTAQEFITYASGRQNVAFLDIKLSLFKRYNPMNILLETTVSFFFESVRAPAERMEAIAYAFDGREKDLIPVPNAQEQEALEARVKGLQSTYDSFVWAVVHKDVMQKVRDGRYDISLTSTKDHPKLPQWATVMSESAEITDILLTPDLIAAITQAGDAFESLIITDQPNDKPQKLSETTPRKRLSLSLLLKPSPNPQTPPPTLLLFTTFLRLPDTLVQTAHFRPEVHRKTRQTRDDESRKLRKADEDEKAEERRLEGERKKKEVREARVKGMSGEEQRKFLEREREKGQRKQGKKMTKKG